MDSRIPEIKSIPAVESQNFVKDKDKKMANKKAISKGTISFSLGVFNVILTVWLLAKYPQYYIVWHIIKNIILLGYRAMDYHSKKMGYYMLEFCYLANYLSFAYLIICWLKANFESLEFLKVLDVYGPMLFRIGFTWSTGVLAGAVVVFKNSLVFHSIDHMTILATHVGPPFVVWSMRWYSDVFEETWPKTFHTDCTSISCPGDLYSTYILPFLCYIIWWQVPYYVITFVLDAKKIEEENYGTMFNYYENAMDEILFKPFFPNIVNTKIKALIYMGLHAIMSAMVMVIAHFSFYNFWLHTIWLMICVSISTWLGGSYYFAVAMNKDRMLKKMTIEDLQAELLRRKSNNDQKLK
jgi:hypothetical protein